MTTVLSSLASIFDNASGRFSPRARSQGQDDIHWNRVALLPASLAAILMLASLGVSAHTRMTEMNTEHLIAYTDVLVAKALQTR